ncbi:MAG: hypothetical protein HRU14_10940, partial [Planctomycetes bacterium]|nr:hypothetical protein [Planctomycetota bacterium]
MTEGVSACNNRDVAVAGGPIGQFVLCLSVPGVPQVCRKQLLRATTLALAVSTWVGAQTLTVNGSTSHANLQLDPSLTHALVLTGPANVPFHWIADQDPGPSTVGPVTLPVGIPASTIDVGMGMPIPATGTPQESLTI